MNPNTFIIWIWSQGNKEYVQGFKCFVSYSYGVGGGEITLDVMW